MVTCFIISLSLLAHLTHISGHSWIVPIADTEPLSKQYPVFNFIYDDFSDLIIEPELVEKAEKRERKKKPVQTSMADTLGLSLPAAEPSSTALWRDLGMDPSPHSPELANAPDKSVESEEEVAPAGKRVKGKGKQQQSSKSAKHSPVAPILASGKKPKQEFKSKLDVDIADDASDGEKVQKPSLCKTPAPKLEARKAMAIASPKDPLRLQYRTDGPLSLAEIQLMNFLMLLVFAASLPGMTRTVSLLTQVLSLRASPRATNNELLKLLAAIFSHPKVVRLLGVEAVGLGKVYVHALQTAVQSQQTAHLAQEAFSTKLSQFIRSGHNPKSVLDALNNGQSEFSPADEEILAMFFHWPIISSSVAFADKASSEDDVEGSVDKELKAQTAILKRMKAQATKAKESQGQETKTTEASTSGSRTCAGQCLGNPVPTPRSNPPRVSKHTAETKVTAGPSSKRAKVAAKEKA
ncbi:hypothetical protein L218DRAFT_1004621 [Marasmius fiardii PR-910]|nr:hypothetical protein L218DRAFT_1004621 [Marasmius fiardii PR-910]